MLARQAVRSVVTTPMTAIRAAGSGSAQKAGSVSDDCQLQGSSSTLLDIIFVPPPYPLDGGWRATRGRESAV